ncbi:MAG: hypothetical protein R6U95_05535 [Bacteroidales bacterium]
MSMLFSLQHHRPSGTSLKGGMALCEVSTIINKLLFAKSYLRTLHLHCLTTKQSPLEEGRRVLLSCKKNLITSIYISLTQKIIPQTHTHRPSGTSLKGGIALCEVSTHFSPHSPLAQSIINPGDKL